MHVLILMSSLHTTCRYRRLENGEYVPYNASREVTTNRCCDGYSDVGKYCAKDFCSALNCTEDPNSRCVLVKRCNAIFPIFVNQHGILSDQCTQPKEAQDHLCPNGGDICDAGSVCPGDTSGEAVCLGKGCGCSAGPVWHTPELREVDQC